MVRKQPLNVLTQQYICMQEYALEEYVTNFRSCQMKRWLIEHLAFYVETFIQDNSVVVQRRFGRNF